jgi:hypothetical protein
MYPLLSTIIDRRAMEAHGRLRFEEARWGERQQERE